MLVHSRHKGAYHELKSRKLGPCKVLKKISSNACLIALPSKLHVSPIFNVHDSFKEFDEEVASINKHVYKFPKEVTETVLDFKEKQSRRG